ncbi:hypothetical protein Tco_1276387 [Tanacetum coccineum]
MCNRFKKCAILEIRTTKRAWQLTFADVSLTANEQVLSRPIYFAVCCLLSGSHAYAIESLKSILKNSPRKGDKDPREFDRTRDTDRYGHMVRYTDQSLRGKRGRDTDSDSDDDSYHMSRSHLRVRYKHRLSGFDIAPPASATSFSDGAVTAPTVHGMFQNMPVQLMTQHATRHARHVYVGGISSTVKEQSVVTFFSYVMATIGGNTAGPCDAVVNVYINLEEASNAIALDGLCSAAGIEGKGPKDDDGKSYEVNLDENFRTALGYKMPPALGMTLLSELFNEVGFPVTNTSFDALLESLISTAKPFFYSAGYRILAS